VNTDDDANARVISSQLLRKKDLGRRVLEQDVPAFPNLFVPGISRPDNVNAVNTHRKNLRDPTLNRLLAGAISNAHKAINAQ
jgi:hypothetical protein